MLIEVVSLETTSIKAHPDGTGALKNGPQFIDKSRGRWNTNLAALGEVIAIKYANPDIGRRILEAQVSATLEATLL